MEPLTPHEELMQLPWAEEVQECEIDDYKGYKVRSRPGVFRIDMTHKIQRGRSAYDPGFAPAEKLATPTILKLPAYWMYMLLPTNGRGGYFYYSLADKPDAKENQIGMVPQYQNVISKERYDQKFTPCYGHADGEANSLHCYRRAKTWRERAEECAIYLQAAVPHYTNTWYVTAFAYRLGLVGEEMMTEPKRISVEEIDEDDFD